MHQNEDSYQKIMFECVIEDWWHWDYQESRQPEDSKKYIRDITNLVIKTDDLYLQKTSNRYNQQLCNV